MHMICRGRFTMSTSMADTETDSPEREDINGLKSSQISSDDTEDKQVLEEPHPIFSNGHLSYIGHEAFVIPLTLIRDYCNKTRSLDLSFNCLRSLDGLEEFTNLEELILDNNEIDDDVQFPSLQKLTTLTLNKNKISDLDHLIEMICVKFPCLSYLSILGNVACPNQLSSYDKDEEDYQRYRYYVLYHLPKLKFLDSSQVKTGEVNEAARVGPFMKVVRPDGNDKSLKKDAPDSDVPYSPLPNSRRQEGQHIGTYGACKYVYYGRHSEGNRFIKNADL